MRQWSDMTVLASQLDNIAEHTIILATLHRDLTVMRRQLGMEPFYVGAALRKIEKGQLDAIKEVRLLKGIDSCVNRVFGIHMDSSDS